MQRRSSSSSTIKVTDHSAHSIRSNANSNNMSVSVPNLSLNAINVNDSTVGLLDAFATVARRRNQNSNVQNSSNVTNNVNAGNSLLSRGSNNVCSLVRLALSSNFPGNLPGFQSFTFFSYYSHYYKFSSVSINIRDIEFKVSILVSKLKCQKKFFNFTFNLMQILSPNIAELKIFHLN